MNRIAAPYCQGESQCQAGSAPQTRCWTLRDRDILGRVIETTLPDGSEKVTSLGADGALGDHYEKITYDEYGRTGRLLGIRGTKSAAGDVQDLTYAWDALGNLTRRREQSGSKDLTETFAYDGLNRLKSSTVASRSTVTATYDSYGNLRSKSDVGTYAYFADRPNTLKTAGGATYAYDANGNNTSGDGRTLTYTVFDKVATVAKSGHATAFEYGPDRMRYLRTDIETGQTTTTLYIGGVEKVTHPDGRREVRRYIDGLVIETKKYSAAGTLTDTDEQYVMKDHLGSADVITDAAGAVAQEMSFDPWGQRRNAADWNALSGSALTDFDATRTPRGFTGHEHLDAAATTAMPTR